MVTSKPNDRGNADKCQLITNKKGNFSITIKDEVVSNSETAKILGVTFGPALSFEPHIRQICRIGNSKLNAIARMSPFLNIQQRLKIDDIAFELFAMHSGIGRGIRQRKISQEK